MPLVYIPLISQLPPTFSKGIFQALDIYCPSPILYQGRYFSSTWTWLYYRNFLQVTVCIATGFLSCVISCEAWGEGACKNIGTSQVFLALKCSSSLGQLHLARSSAPYLTTSLHFLHPQDFLNDKL